jgi:hypothetical protein
MACPMPLAAPVTSAISPASEKLTGAICTTSSSTAAYSKRRIADAP